MFTVIIHEYLSPEVNENSGQPVTNVYTAPVKFTGEIENVTIDTE